VSYAKEMIALAADWVALNPSASGMLKLPRSVLPIHLHTSDPQWLPKREHELANMKDPKRAEEIREAIEKYKGLLAEMSASFDKLHADIEYDINTSESSGEAKYKLAEQAVTAFHGRWLLAWAYSSYSVFELSNDFVAAMLLTDPRDIRFDELRAPFQGILITLPQGFIVGAEGLSYTKIHLYYVDDGWGLYASDGVHVLDTRIGDGQALSWDLMQDIESVANKATSKQVAHEYKVTTEADGLAIRTIRQLTFGMLAYVTAVERAVEERLVDAPKKKRADDTDRVRQRVYDVGRTIKIDPALVRLARSGSREIAFQIKHRFMVTGHYRNQPHGPGRQERKRIWIMPFMKGPEDGAKIVHTYKPEPPAMPERKPADTQQAENAEEKRG